MVVTNGRAEGGWSYTCLLASLEGSRMRINMEEVYLVLFCENMTVWNVLSLWLYSGKVDYGAGMSKIEGHLDAFLALLKSIVTALNPV